MVPGLRSVGLRRPGVWPWNKDADGAALRAQRPKSPRKTRHQKRGGDVKTVRHINADCDAGYSGACQVEEDAGIRPFLEPRKTRHEYGNGSAPFPNSDECKEI